MYNTIMMPRTQIRLLLTTWALVLTWVGFIGFGLYAWVMTNEIKRYTITYDCEISEQLESTPLEVKARCRALRTRR
jgi:Trk-type K+ transport system membrane component